MSYSITASYALNLSVRETLAAGVIAATRPIITHAGFNSSGNVTPATKFAAFQKALVAGVGTIDLTALVGTAGVAVDGTGLKVQAIKIQNPSTNTNVLTIAPGASNGYNLCGASSKITLNPGEEFIWRGVDNTNVPDVAAGAKNLALTDASAGGTELSNWVIVLG